MKIGANEAVDGLWLHQGDVIRAYAEHHQDAEDLALELPTGSGKTLPGLLIAEWVRRKGEGPVVYATPTKLSNSRARFWQRPVGRAFRVSSWLAVTTIGRPLR